MASARFLVLRLIQSGSRQPARSLSKGRGAFPYTLNLTLDNDGIFNLPAVLAGPFTAQLTTPLPFPLFGSASGTVTPNQTTNLQVQVQPSGTITGLVLRPDGTTPAVGADVTIQIANGSVKVQAQTDGTFTVQGVPLGTFSIFIHDLFTEGFGAVSAGTLSVMARRWMWAPSFLTTRYSR